MWSLINSNHVAPLIFGVSLKHFGIDCNKLSSFVALAAVVMKM
jgi:peptide subunit release factor RF-3